ncbi:MAG: hypothetical protein M3044_08190, partial [Thermoproteota archaeon]|nr:hypothetical protein [Thermoproteota archaeon]
STTYDDITIALDSMKALVIVLPKAPVPPVTNTILFEKSWFILFSFSIQDPSILALEVLIHNSYKNRTDPSLLLLL